MRDAKTPAELKAATERMQQLRERKPPVNAPTPANNQPDEDGTMPPAKPGDAAPAPVAEETPGETAPGDAKAEDAPPAETTDEDAEETPEADGPVTIPTAKNLRVRLSEEDKVGRLALSFKQRNRDWTMEQAMDAARTQLGVKAPADKATPAEPSKPKSDLPQTVAEVDTAVDSLLEERTKATIELRFEDQNKIDLQLRRLDRHRIDLVRQEENTARETTLRQNQEYDSGFTRSEQRAAEMYDFANDPKSDGAKRMLEIEADLKANEDPLYFSPDKPLKIAQMVARELNIAPRKKGAPAAAKPATPTAAAAQKKQVLPGGSSRTVPVTTPTKPGDVAAVESIKTMQDLRAFQKKIGIKV